VPPSASALTDHPGKSCLIQTAACAAIANALSTALVARNWEGRTIAAAGPEIIPLTSSSGGTKTYAIVATTASKAAGKPARRRSCNIASEHSDPSYAISSLEIFFISYPLATRATRKRFGSGVWKVKKLGHRPSFRASILENFRCAKRKNLLRAVKPQKVWVVRAALLYPMRRVPYFGRRVDGFIGP
jgi:hypothetical protein